jgi:small subunit ribosomal protein S1
MENENQDQEQEVPQTEDKNSSDQPGWFRDFVDHYDVDKPQQGEMLKGEILDIQEGSILLDVGLKSDAIVPGQDLEKIDPEYLSSLSIGDEVTVGVIRTPLGDDDLLVSLQRGLTQKTWIKAEELAANDQHIELKVVDQNRGGLLVDFENIRAFVPNSHIPAIRRGTSTQKAGEIKAEMIGKRLPLKVIEVDQKERKLVFSARVAQPEQRLKRLEEIQVGDVIKSRVVNIVDFGVFVDLDGVDGLVHKSEIDWDRVPHPAKMYNLGDEIEVKVISVDKANERVSLSRKVLLQNPWDKLVKSYKVGDLVEGVVVSVLDFGAFVEIQDGLHGLVHISEIGYANTEDPKAALKKGDPILVKILGIEPARERISLSMRRVPISEQMEWIMNLEDLSEALLLESDAEGLPQDEVEAVELLANSEEDHPQSDETGTQGDPALKGDSKSIEEDSIEAIDAEASNIEAEGED